ncbi:flagellar motor switch protein FliM [Glutamicibacter creatinolyticus]|uniref:flagellar motor switch protein FliM n=1 Tax=Glutamicibacter creatinolyticus TaxID=162496 RepID=UPI0033EE2DBA
MPAGRPVPGGPSSTARKATGAVVYDFRRPTTLAREHARVLELAFETFARQWGTQLTARIRVMSQVSLLKVATLTYDDYVAGLPAATTMVLCETGGQNARVVIQFPAAEALNWVAHMLGSRTAFEAPERPFTRIESTLVRGLMNEAIEDLHYSLGALLQQRLTVSSMSHQSQFAQAAAKSEVMITALLRVRVGERTSQATVAMPAEMLLPQLGEANPRTPVEDAAGLLAQTVGTVPLEVALSLTPCPVTPSTILELAVGDVLPLDHRVHQPLELTAGGQQVGTAAAGTRSGRMAAVIVSTEEYHA